MPLAWAALIALGSAAAAALDRMARDGDLSVAAHLIRRGAAQPVTCACPLLDVPRSTSASARMPKPCGSSCRMDCRTPRTRTGVLIFVSVAERYAVILADAGINQKVTQQVWDQASLR